MNEFLNHLAELTTDPAHLAFEVLTTAVIEGLILSLFWPLIKRHIHRDIATEHQTIDAEHGIEHEVAKHAFDESVPLSYVEGWLWGMGFEAASRYLQDPEERAKIADQYREDILRTDNPAGTRLESSVR